jgi:quinol monooxygenase YgiN
MIVATIHEVSSDKIEKFVDTAESWLTGLSTLPGWIRGSISRSPDEPTNWLIYQQWSDVGSCRRGLSNLGLRALAYELALSASSSISTFEPLIIAEGAVFTNPQTILAKDAFTIALGDAAGPEILGENVR